MRLLQSRTNNSVGSLTQVIFNLGETIALGFQLFSCGSPLNIATYSFKVTIQAQEALVLSTQTSGITILNATNGIVSVNLTNAQSQALTLGSWPFDGYMESVNDSQITPFVIGSMIVNPTETSLP